MSGVRVSELPAASSIAASDLLLVVQGGVTKQTTSSGIKTYLNTGRVVNVFDYLSASEMVDVESGTHAIDVSASIQNAVNACDGILYFPQGTYKCGDISITKPLTVIGSGGSTVASLTIGTFFYHKDATSSIFIVDSMGGVTFQDFCIYGNPQVSGSSILVKYTAPSTVTNFGTQVNRVHTTSCYYSVNMESALLFGVQNCIFWNIPVGGVGIVARDTYKSDQGDGFVTGCTFGGFGSAVTWYSGGGFRFNNNKTLTTIAITADLSTPEQTSQFLITDNNIDGGVISLNQQSGVLPFGDITITGNLITGYTTTNPDINILGIAGAHIVNVKIANNILRKWTGDTATDGFVVDYVDVLDISNNQLYNMNGTRTAIIIGANVTSGQVLDNNIIGWSTEITNNSSSGVRVRGRQQSGATSVSDGGTISHNLGVSPSKVVVNGTVANNVITVTSVSSSTITLAIKLGSSGAAGSTQTVYWEAEV